MILPEAPKRIVLLHFDSLCCLPALNLLFASLGPRIGLVISSDRFAGWSGFWRQLKRNLWHSGVRMTFALGFDIVALRAAAFFAPMMRLFGRHTQLYTVSEHARRIGSPCLVAADINSPEALTALRQFAPDLVISFHFDQILKEAFFQAVAAPIVNVHPALLPAHRGPCPSFWVLAAAEANCGVTVHRVVDEAIDAGEALARRQRPLPKAFSMAELDEGLFRDGADLLLTLLDGQGVASMLGPVSGTPRERSMYESFPDRLTVRTARLCGVRLLRFSHSARLLMALFGWCRVRHPFRAIVDAL